MVLPKYLVIFKKDIMGFIIYMLPFPYFFRSVPLLHEFNSVRMGCKTHVLHHLIIDCHIDILLKIQYILPHLLTFQ